MHDGVQPHCVQAFFTFRQPRTCRSASSSFSFIQMAWCNKPQAKNTAISPPGCGVLCEDSVNCPRSSIVLSVTQNIREFTCVQSSGTCHRLCTCLGTLQGRGACNIVSGSNFLLCALVGQHVTQLRLCIVVGVCTTVWAGRSCTEHHARVLGLEAVLLCPTGWGRKVVLMVKVFILKSIQARDERRYDGRCTWNFHAYGVLKSHALCMHAVLSPRRRAYHCLLALPLTV
jgi:hypothetical protein